LHFPINLPPLVEQRAIAAVLTAIDDTIAKSETLCSDLFVATEALTEALCLGIDPMTRERNVIGWRPSSLAAEMSSIQVGIVVKPASYYVDEGGVLALRSLNIRENRLDLKKIVRISSNGHSLNRKSSLRPGDVVTVRTGEPGTTAVVPKDLETLNCIDIIFSRPRPTLRSEYASFFLNSRVAKRQIAVLQGGLAQQHLNVGEMRRIKILVPPVGEQDRIVNILSGMWLRNDAERAALDQLKDVRAVLAQELLSGRVRLPGIIVMRHRDNPARAA
jgi:restriction endonuclease S subunit